MLRTVQSRSCCSASPQSASAAPRPTNVDDKLTIRMFGWSTRGFAAAEDRSVAVCLLLCIELFFAEGVTLGTGLGPGLSHSFFVGFDSLDHWIAPSGMVGVRSSQTLVRAWLARSSYPDTRTRPHKYVTRCVVCLLFASPRWVYQDGHLTTPYPKTARCSAAQRC
jgi:hypothetical protein